MPVKWFVLIHCNNNASATRVCIIHLVTQPHCLWKPLRCTVGMELFNGWRIPTGLSLGFSYGGHRTQQVGRKILHQHHHLHADKQSNTSLVKSGQPNVTKQ